MRPEYEFDPEYLEQTRERAAAQLAAQDLERETARFADILERVQALGYRRASNADDRAPAAFMADGCGWRHRVADDTCHTRGGSVELLVLSPAYTMTGRDGEPFDVVGLDTFANYDNLGAAMVALADPNHELRGRCFQIIVHLHPTLVPEEEVVGLTTLDEMLARCKNAPAPLPGVDDAKATAALRARA